MIWDVAHKVAAIAAVQAHEEFGVDRASYVDVHAALRTAGVYGLARPTATLFGVYYSKTHGGPAVLLNERLDIVAQRHTAAHELGHHRLGDGTSFDKELDRARQWGDGSWPDQEKIAEAFAAWFLMPRPAVFKALQLVGVARPQTPHEVYRTARWLGTSYAGTARHLQRLRLASRAQVDAWLKVAPGQVKQELAGPVPADCHVHVLGPAAYRATVRADAGDVLVVDVPKAQLGPLPAGLEPFVPDAGPGEIVAARLADDPPAQVSWTVDVAGADEPFTVNVARQSPRRGDIDTWPL